MIHSSHHQQQNQPFKTPTVEETPKKPTSDEFIPASALEQEEIEKRGGIFDWEELLDKHRIAFSENAKQSDESSDLDEQSPEETWIPEETVERVARLQATDEITSLQKQRRRNDTFFIVIVGACCAVGAVGLVAAVIFWYKIQKRAESAAAAEYPSYGVTGPNTGGGGKISPSSTMSDRKLAQSAQMYHYQQQRQQMMAQEKAHLDTKPLHSDDSDDEAPEGGDYTVYECPGLAPTGEMEVRNPLFTEQDSSLLSSPTGSYPAMNSHFPQLSTSPPKEKLSP